MATFKWNLKFHTVAKEDKVVRVVKVEAAVIIMKMMTIISSIESMMHTLKSLNYKIIVYGSVCIKTLRLRPFVLRL